MRFGSMLAGCAVATLPLVALAADEVSVERGKQVSIFAGCHDCHTPNYMETNGQIDAAVALKGTAIGWRGPWGTTYPMNLRITAGERSEDEFVTYLKELKTRPPMPWFNLSFMDESDLRSLYQYIKSLGEPGEQVPEYVPPDQEPKTPFYPIIPPAMPKP